MVGEQRNTIAPSVNTLAVRWTVITPQLPEKSGGCFAFNYKGVDMLNIKKDTLYIVILLSIVITASLAGAPKDTITIMFWLALIACLAHRYFSDKTEADEKQQSAEIKDEVNEAEAFRDELALRLYEEGVDNSVDAANKVTEAQFGKPIDELIDSQKYKSKN